MNRHPAASFRTLAVGLGGLVVIAVVRTVVVLGFLDEVGASVAVSIGELALAVTAATIALAVAARIGRYGERARPWSFLGLGILLYSGGNAVGNWLNVVPGGPIPYPGPPDVLYVASYLLLAASLLDALAAFRDLADVRPAIGIAVTTGLVFLGIMYAGLLGPYVTSVSGVSSLEKALSLFYSFSDVMLLAVPSLAIILVLIRLDAARFAWPWGFVCVGAIFLASSDTAFALVSAAGTYREGGLINYGWMAAHVAFAVGASLALDTAVHRSRTHSQFKVGPSRQEA